MPTRDDDRDASGASGARVDVPAFDPRQSHRDCATCGAPRAEYVAADETLWCARCWRARGDDTT